MFKIFNKSGRVLDICGQTIKTGESTTPLMDAYYEGSKKRIDKLESMGLIMKMNMPEINEAELLRKQKEEADRLWQEQEERNRQMEQARLEAEANMKKAAEEARAKAEELKKQEEKEKEEAKKAEAVKEAETTKKVETKKTTKATETKSTETKKEESKEVEENKK